MRQKVATPGAGAILLLGGFALLAAGCSIVDPFRAPPPEQHVDVPELPPKPEVPAPDPEVSVPEPTAAAPAPAPDQPPTPPTEAVEEPVRLAVLLSSRAPDYEGVAHALEAAAGDVDVYDLSDKSLTQREILDSVLVAGSEVVIAVGYRAAAFAQTIGDLPVVYAQVFNAAQLDLSAEHIKGVAVLPPLDRQLAAWRELNPNLSSIGAIVGAGHEELLAQAEQASAEHGIRFQHRLAQSDRETLYLFTRLVPEIDGFLLFPDNRVLSASVLRQMLTYAARHQVQVAVFNDSLLSIGATISTTAVEEDIADTILLVAERLLSDDPGSVPEVSPLSEIEVRVNDGTFQTADLSSPAETGY